MTLEADIIEKINASVLTPEILVALVLDYAETFCTHIKQKFYRKKAGIDGKKFSEYVLIENIRALYRCPAVVFYILIENHEKLKHILGLEYLTTHDAYRDYDRKRKSFKRDIKKIMKRNLKKKVDKMYILDTTIGETDLSKIRKGRFIKNGAYDAEFVHSSVKGTVVGFTVCTLINWSNVSVEKVKFFPKHASKKEMWKKMVIDTLGTK